MQGKKFLLFFICFTWLAQSSIFAQSQLQDDFSDGNHSSNPTWIGNTADFTVNANGRLQLNAVSTGSTPRYLAVNASTSIQDSTTWEFFSFQDFSPSATNYSRVYLTSNVSDLTGSLNGYYVKLGGSSGTTDSLSLFRQSGNTSTLVCTSPASTMGGNTTTAAVRVSRNTSGEWFLYADYTGGTNYTLQGRGIDATHTSGEYMGVHCIFTTTRASHFQFDNFSVTPLFADNTAPLLVSATASNANTIQLTFNEALASNSVSNIANYSVNNGITIASAQLNANDNKVIELITNNTLSNGTTYTITVNNITDLAGNAMSSSNTNFIYYELGIAVYGDILINEIMADQDPQVSLPLVEFVELYNRSNKYINLAGFVFYEGGNHTLPAHIMAPNTYVLITANANKDSLTQFGTVLGIPTMTLTNSGEFLSLADANNNIIDSVTFSDTWYQSSTKKNGGWTLELINPNQACKGASNWIASTNSRGGTPNAINSVYDSTLDNIAPSLTNASISNETTITLSFDDVLNATTASNTNNYTINNGITVTNAVFNAPNQVVLTLNTALINQTTYTITVNNVSDCVGNIITGNNTQNVTYMTIVVATPEDIIFNELMIDESPQVGLPLFEYIELYNKSNNAINLQGLQLLHASTSSTTVNTSTLPAYVLMPGEYVVLHSTAANSDFANLISNHIAVPSFPSLNNTAAKLTLRRDDLTIINEVTYSNQWYRDNSKKDGGWSLELINPNQLCKLGDNWRASNDITGGTPGRQNSIYDITPDVSMPNVINIYALSPSQIIIEVDESLNEATAIDMNNYMISNGITIANIQLLGARTIQININGTMVHNVTYTIDIDGVKDCLDNTISTTVTVAYFDTEAAAHYDILINEIYADTNPTVGLPPKQYIELFNRSNKYINLINYTIQDASTTVAELPFHILAPNAYVIIAPNNGDTITFSNFGTALLVNNFPTLNNSDNVILRDYMGNVIDATSYTTSTYQNSTKSSGGWSLERINPNAPCVQEGNWIASNNMLGGTPGQPNSVLVTTADENKAQLLRAFPLTPTSVRLYFDKAIHDTDAITANFYTISANGGQFITVTRATIEMPYYNTVVLTLSEALAPNTIYTITLDNNFRDCIGTPIGTANTCKIALPQTIAANDIIINEVLFNPITGGSDFVELFNISDKVVNVKDIIFANATASGDLNATQAITTDFLIFPNDYLVVTPSPEHIKAQYNPENPHQIIKNNLPTYDDNNGTVWIFTTANNEATTIDKFAYTKDMHHAMLSDQNGVSLERISPYAPSQDNNNWHSGASVNNYATPTYKNASFRATDNLQTENLIDIPNEKFSPDGDGYEDFLIINYNLDNLGYVARIQIYDVAGRLVRTLSDGELFGQEGYITWDGATDNAEKASTGIYVVYIQLTNPNGKIYNYKKSCVVASRFN